MWMFLDLRFLCVRTSEIYSVLFVIKACICKLMTRFDSIYVNCTTMDYWNRTRYNIAVHILTNFSRYISSFGIFFLYLLTTKFKREYQNNWSFNIVTIYFQNSFFYYVPRLTGCQRMDGICQDRDLSQNPFNRRVTSVSKHLSRQRFFLRDLSQNICQHIRRR